jgi:hypothetical protein
MYIVVYNNNFDYFLRNTIFTMDLDRAQRFPSPEAAHAALLSNKAKGFTKTSVVKKCRIVEME